MTAIFTNISALTTTALPRNKRSTGATLIRRIFEVSNWYDMPLIKYSEGTDSLLLVNEKGCNDLDEDYIISLLDNYPRIGPLVTYDNCCHIAKEVARLGLASETEHILQGCGLTSIPYLNHFCNYKVLQDSTHLSIDFTLADQLSDFQILAIRAKTKEELFEKLHHVYGGTWQLFHNEGMLD